MARITIEDCLEKIPNHFQLVLVASRRARQLQDGAMPRIEVGDEKPNIIALREIAAGVVGEDILDEPLIKDATAEQELADLIAHGLMNQDVSDELGHIIEDGEDNESDGGGGLELDPLEAGNETIEGMEKIADLNLDHLPPDGQDAGPDDNQGAGEPSDEVGEAAAAGLSADEIALGDQLLPPDGETPGEVAEEKPARAEKEPKKGKPAKEKPA